MSHVPDELERCYLAARRILDYRFNSEAELRRKLSRRDFAEETVSSTISRLAAEGWLDDTRFAGAFVRTRAGRRIGRGRIRRELRSAGVSDEVIVAAVHENLDLESEQAALADLCARRVETMKRQYGAAYPASEEGRQRLIGYLLRRGYDMTSVTAAVREAVR